ncbi:hypothetical protein ACRE_072560 [Hapsidospora chrysogenum ATCC 11550]|uniref:Uncharacterized protein n=1 Tax=Hapsidospora chrysogenum (strain ATCC 11550 / CBS 779.69 / DSM 880 / IAM 14645 / JCM 23072 / IMI 49137) TaxID=857340 RepID=A0A086SY41_HAPC1|nr:hypothetical protein ACRE_072560 [Hapsidospora chrysogenum ATCC 11550]
MIDLADPCVVVEPHGKGPSAGTKDLASNEAEAAEGQGQFFCETQVTDMSSLSGRLLVFRRTEKWATSNEKSRPPSVGSVRLN